MISFPRSLLTCAAVVPFLIVQGTGKATALRVQTKVVKTAVPSSQGVEVTFGDQVATFTLNDLMSLPQVTIQVRNAGLDRTEEYSGPLLADLFDKVGIEVVREGESKILHSSVVATGSYRYSVVYSLAEVEPSFNSGKVIVAVKRAGHANEEGGAIELVNTADVNSSRWVRGLTKIKIVSMTSDH